MGSKGSRALARTPNSISSWNASGISPTDGSRSRKTAPLPCRSSVIDIRFSVNVPVLSVHRTVAEPKDKFNGRSASGQHPRPRNPPSAHGHEHGEHDGKLLRQHRHAERDARQHRVEPSAAQTAVEQHGHAAHHSRDNGEHAHQSPGVPSWSRGGSGRRVLSDCPIRPISLQVPVAITSPIPVPRTTSEPEYTYGKSSPPGLRISAGQHPCEQSCAPVRTRQSAAIHPSASRGFERARHRPAPDLLPRAPRHRRAPPHDPRFVGARRRE